MVVASAARPPVGTIVAWFLIVLGVTYLVALGGGGFFGLYSVTFRIVSVVSLTAALVVWLALAWRRPFWRPNSSLALALVLALTALAIALAFAERQRLGADYLAYAALLSGAYLLLQRLFAHPFFGPRLGGLAVLLGFALCIVFIVRVFSLWLEFWAMVGRLTVPPLRPGFEGLAYGHPGTFATVVILLWLASIAHLGLSTPRARLVIGVLGLLVAFVVVVTGARGAWVALGIAIAVTAAVWLVDRDHRRVIGSLLRSRRVRLGLAGAGVLAGLLLVALLPAIVRRLSEPASEVRSIFNATAIRMFQDAPIAGLGPGMWSVERARYTLGNEQDYYVPHAHNLYLQTVAELGIVGLIAGFVVAISLGRLVWLGIRSTDVLAHRLGWTSLLALVYLAVHQLVDFYPNMAALGFLLALLISRLDAVMSAESPWNGAILPQTRPVFGGRLGVVALVLATAASTGWLLRSESAAQDGQQATDAANDGNWAGALAAARRAVATDPGMPPYLFTRGLAAAHEGQLEEAAAAMREAAEIDDYPLAWLNVAALELQLGNDAQARLALERAQRLGIQNPQLDLAAMALYLRMGDQEGAVSAATSALLPMPSLASDPIWQSSPELRRTLAAALALASERGTPPDAFWMALEAEAVEDARALVGSMPATEQARYETFLRAWDGDVTAFQEIQRTASSNPLDLTTAGTCHRVAAHARTRGLAWECIGTSIENSPVIRTGFETDGRVEVPGPNSAWHFQYVYRRMAPFDELVPGLPKLAWVVP